MKKKYRNWQYSFFLLLLVGCAHPPLAPIGDQAKFVETIAKENPGFFTLKTSAKVVIKSNKGTARFRMNLLLKNKSFYIETYGFGVPQGYASLNNNQLFVVVPSSRSVYVGMESSSMEKILGVDVTPSILFDVLFRRHFSAQSGPFKIESSKKEYVVHDSLHNTFHVTAEKRIDRVENPNTRWREIRYGEPSSNGYPKSVDVFLPNGSVRLEFENTTVDSAIESKLFQIDVPSAGFHIYSM